MTRKNIIVHRSSCTLEYGTVEDHGNNFEKIDKWDCVVGSSEGPTDLGTFKVLLKDKDKVSSKYYAPMKYSLKFSSDYKAIHSTGFALVRSWAQYFGARDTGSHGCVGIDRRPCRNVI
jgi:hypothetical protein